MKASLPDAVQSMSSFITFLSTVSCGKWSSLEEIRTSDFRKKHLTDETRHYPSKLETELEAEVRDDPALASAPIKTRASKLFSKYISQLKEKLTACLTPSDAEEFLELMLAGVKPEDVERFLEKSCNAIKHRFCDAAETLGISSVILILYWKHLIKPQLLIHIGPGGYRTRLASLLIRWRVSEVDKVDTKALMKYFPKHDVEQVKKALEQIARKSKDSTQRLYQGLLRDNQLRLLHIFDQIREYFAA